MEFPELESNISFVISIKIEKTLSDKEIVELDCLSFNSSYDG